MQGYVSVTLPRMKVVGKILCCVAALLILIGVYQVLSPNYRRNVDFYNECVQNQLDLGTGAYSRNLSHTYDECVSGLPGAAFAPAGHRKIVATCFITFRKSVWSRARTARHKCHTHRARKCRETREARSRPFRDIPWFALPCLAQSSPKSSAASRFRSTVLPCFRGQADQYEYFRNCTAAKAARQANTP